MEPDLETEIETFDLIEFQQLAREMCDPKKLYELWEDMCSRYERHEIGLYQLEEMKEVIWPTLRQLAAVRKAVNAEVSAKVKAKAARRRKTG